MDPAQRTTFNRLLREHEELISRSIAIVGLVASIMGLLVAVFKGNVRW